MPWCNGQDEKIKSFCEGGYTKGEKSAFRRWLSIIYNGCNPLKMGYIFFEGVTPLVSCWLSVCYVLKLGMGVTPYHKTFYFFNIGN